MREPSARIVRSSVMGRRDAPGYQQISVGEDAARRDERRRIRYHVSRLRRPTCLLPTTSRRTAGETPQAILSGIFEMTRASQRESWRQLEAISLCGHYRPAMVVEEGLDSVRVAGSGSRDVVLAPSPFRTDQRSGCTAPRQPERWGLRAPAIVQRPALLTTNCRRRPCG